jgi:hypothetical protein
MIDSKRMTWEKYAIAWREPSKERKLVCLRESVVPACTYRDPNTIIEGHGALADYMMAFHEHVPGGWFDTKSFLAHHGRSIAKWEMVDGAGKVIGDGVSYAEYDERGFLLSMNGFFDAPDTPGK